MELLCNIIKSKSGLLRLIQSYFDKINRVDIYGSRYMIDTKNFITSLLNIACYDSIFTTLLGLNIVLSLTFASSNIWKLLFQFVDEPFGIFLKQFCFKFLFFVFLLFLLFFSSSFYFFSFLFSVIRVSAIACFSLFQKRTKKVEKTN